jgi:hypothetical protein
VHQSEVLANLTKPVEALLGAVSRGEVSEVLSREPRPAQVVSGGNRRLSPADVDQLVADYRAGVGSVYVLADRYGVHRNTVAARLKERGVPLGRQPLDEFETKRARELHDKGLSLNAIGLELGRDPKSVKRSVAGLDGVPLLIAKSLAHGDSEPSQPEDQQRQRNG